MNNQLSSDHTKLDKFLTDEQFDRVGEAILSGKYSWACVLILHFAGYNPVQYIPYRTYNRILNSTYKKRQNNQNKTDSINLVNSAVVTNNDRKLGAIADLEYLEIASDRSSEINGGSQKLPLDLSHWFYLSE